MNRNNWYPVVPTLILGSPDETDEDTKATLDLLSARPSGGISSRSFVPSIFTLLQDTRMAGHEGVSETTQLTSLQWQLIMKCWSMNLRAAQFKWWAPAVWGLGASGLVDFPAAQAEWAEIYLSSAAVFRRRSREADGENGKNLHGKTAGDQEPQRTSLRGAPPFLETPAHRHWRHARRYGCSPEPRGCFGLKAIRQAPFPRGNFGFS